MRICLQGHQPFMAAARAIADTMRALRDGGEPDSQALADPGDIERWSEQSRYDAWRKTFLDLDN